MVQKIVAGIAVIFVLGALWLGIYRFVLKGQLPKLTNKPAVTVTPTPPPSQLSAKMNQEVLIDKVKVYMIALEDNGKLGKAVGCGDSVVPVEVQVQPTNAPLKAALDALLSIREETYGQGLYNSLAQSDMRVESVDLSKGAIATVHLTGTQTLSGVCDDPRIIAQIRETALQFPSVQNVEIFINSYPIEQILTGRGQ